ncbi:MAG: hypothetical protein LUF85_04970 [Bacteroides sp.]|nr:hypothetical protein [Bacteroides sp.]
MVSVYILTFKETNEKHYFTSLVALYENFDSDVLKVKYTTLSKRGFKTEGPYENKAIKIVKITALSKGDAEKLGLKKKEK